MLATLEGRRRRRGDGWAWELKWDGIRAIGYVDGGRIRLVSRNGNDVTRRYPELRRLGEALGARDVVLDGEIVAFDDSGRPSFELLQRRMHVESDSTIRRLVGEVPVTYVLFDLLWLDGHSTMDLPYTERRALLARPRAQRRVVADAAERGGRRRGDDRGEHSASGSKASSRSALDSRYEPGRRSPAWVKIKNHSRPGVRRRRMATGREGPHRQHRLAARRLLRRRRAALRGQGRQRAVRPGDRRARAAASRSARATTARSARAACPKGVRFVDPLLVVEVRFTEWTTAGQHPPSHVPGHPHRQGSPRRRTGVRPVSRRRSDVIVEADLGPDGLAVVVSASRPSRGPTS